MRSSIIMQGSKIGTRINQILLLKNNYLDDKGI
jgi:hypothetical protein